VTGTQSELPFHFIKRDSCLVFAALIEQCHQLAVSARLCYFVIEILGGADGPIFVIFDRLAQPLFIIRHSDLIRHSDFVIRHFKRPAT
jgi:hypothetical protein